MFNYRNVSVILFVFASVISGCEKDEEKGPEGGLEVICRADCGGEEAGAVAGEESQAGDEVVAGEEAVSGEEAQAGDEVVAGEEVQSAGEEPAAGEEVPVEEDCLPPSDSDEELEGCDVTVDPEGEMASDMGV